MSLTVILQGIVDIGEQTFAWNAEDEEKLKATLRLGICHGLIDNARHQQRHASDRMCTDTMDPAHWAGIIDELNAEEMFRDVKITVTSDEHMLFDGRVKTIMHGWRADW